MKLVFDLRSPDRFTFNLESLHVKSSPEYEKLDL